GGGVRMNNEESKPAVFELGIEFAVELLLFFIPYGADQMGLPHNFWLGLASWIVATVIAVRMFWIFPLWAKRLTRATKTVISGLALGAFIVVVYGPLRTAYAKWNTDRQSVTAKSSSATVSVATSGTNSATSSQVSPPLTSLAATPSKKKGKYHTGAVVPASQVETIPKQSVNQSPPTPGMPTFNFSANHSGIEDSQFTGVNVNVGGIPGTPLEDVQWKHNVMEAASSFFVQQEIARQQEILDATNPRFVPKSLRLYFGDSSSGSVEILAYAELANEGQPSKIIHWTLGWENELSKGSSDGVPLSKDVTVQDPKGTIFLDTRSSPSTPEIATRESLKQGATAKAWIHFQVPIKDKGTLMKSTKQYVSCRDDKGVDYRIGELNAPVP
ncbi:MAG: hypothetical protein WB919_04640, partial [Candidatus Sulfotelmatobacter sp.]